MLALSTRWLGNRPFQSSTLVDALKEVDLRACAVVRGSPPARPETLRAALGPVGASVVAVEAADGAGEAGLVSRSDDERNLALGGVSAAVTVARAVGGRHVLLNMGRLDLERTREREDEVLAQYRTDGATQEVVRAAVSIQRQVDRHIDQYLDGTCRLLFELCRAEPEIFFSIVTPDSLFGFPNHRALALVFEELGERNLGYWHDCGAARLRESLGLCPQGSWAGEHSTRMFGTSLHDVVGAEMHLPPGAGEIDFRQLIDLLPSRAERVLDVDGRFAATELRLAASFLKAL